MTVLKWPLNHRFLNDDILQLKVISTLYKQYRNKTTDFISSYMYFFYYKCGIIGNNSQTITCMRAQSVPSDQCHWNPANQTPFLKTAIAKYDI